MTRLNHERGDGMISTRERPSWTKELYAVLSDSPWQRKLLLCQSFTEGHLVIERMAKAHGPIANVEVQTMAALALDVASLPLAKRGLRLISDETILWVVHGLLSTLAGSFPDVLDGTSLSPGTVRVFQRAIVELRGHGVHALELESTWFVNVAKGLLLQGLLAGVEAYLADCQLVDIAGAVQLAIEQLSHARLPYDSVIILDDLQQDGLFGTFLDKVKSAISTIHVVGPSRSGFLSAPPGGVQIFAAAGSVAEARGVLRRSMEAGMALDEIEIATSGSDEEVLAIHSQAARFGLPVTFSQGLPGYFTRNGQLATAYLDWIERNYDVSYLLGALREGVLRIRDTDASTHQLSQCLEEANIGWGRSRYLPLLQKIAAEADEETAPHYRVLLGLAQNLFNHLPTDASTGWTVQAVLAALQAILESYGSSRGDTEISVFTQIRDMNQTVALVGTSPMSMQMAIAYTRELLGQIRVNVSTRPEPGALHVSTWTSGGIAGRGLTFVTGLSERNWSVSVTQDPILLDVEKAHIGHGLLRSDERAQRSLADKLRLFHVVSGNLVLSYSAYDVVENKPESPATVLLQAFRASTGQPDADYSELMKTLGQPVGYAAVDEPSGPIPKLDAADVWLTHMVDSAGRVKHAQEAILAVYPGLRAGRDAEAARASAALTAFDGVVGGADSAPARAAGADAAVPRRSYLSTSALETLATCPRKYFYQYALRLRPEEVTEFDRDQWLNPLERGSLYHEVFQTYMAHVTDDGQHAAKHDETLLMQICDEVIDAYREQIPAPSVHIMELDCQQIRASMDKFLSMEEARAGIPRFFELAIGSREAPFMVDLGEGVTLPLSAVVDRVDQLGPSTYRILDYKTGRSSRYRESEPFKGGRQLQHAVYAIAVEQWLVAQRIDPSARVVNSAYVFPTLRARELEVAYAQDGEMREHLREVVSRMLAAIDKGVFPATADYNKACRWCDFLAICTSQASADAKEKRENPDNAALLSELLEVEDYA